MFVLFAVCAADGWAQPADLKARVDALVVELKAAAAPNADLKKSLIDLRAAITTLEGTIPVDAKAADDPAAFANRVDEIVPIAERLAKLTVTPATAAKASALITAAQKLDIKDPTKAATDRAAALKVALDDNGLIKTYPDLRTALIALFPSLDRAEEVYFLDSVIRRSGVLETQLKGAIPGGPPTSVATIQAVDKLQKAIAEYRSQPAPVLDILFAEYGDIGTGKSPPPFRGQLCDATIALRDQCRSKAACTLPASFQTVLCSGRDPAATAAEKNKGAWVLFRCIDAPTLKIYAPPQLPGMVPNPSGTQATWVPLRSVTDLLSCGPREVAVKPKEDPPN